MGKDLSTIDSSDFDIDDTASYGAALATTGKPHPTTPQKDVSTYEWGDIDADSSTGGSSSCSDYNQWQEQGHIVHETLSMDPVIPSLLADGDAFDPVQQKNKNSTGSHGTIANIISLLNPNITWKPILRGLFIYHIIITIYNVKLPLCLDLYQLLYSLCLRFTFVLSIESTMWLYVYCISFMRKHSVSCHR